MSTRDPRVNPERGDKLQGGDGQFLREVISVVPCGRGYSVSYRVNTGAAWWCSLTEWRRWAKSAEVLHVAC